jgi:hypothetical protein
MMCPTLLAEVPDPCPRKHETRGCEDCRVGLDERAAIIQHDGHEAREEADRLARLQALEAMPGQRNLIPG